jgi:hypothetical protein
MLHSRITRLALAAAAFTLASGYWLFDGSAASAQQPKRPRGGGMPMPTEYVADDYTGFQPIFDGTLKGWDGDPGYWRVEDNVIIGETKPDNLLKQNTFLIWRAGKLKDFELKIDFRMNNTNSGIQYRSAEVPEAGKWVLKGYQCDMDFVNRFSGAVYEERGRGLLALRGQTTYIAPGAKPRIIGSLGDGQELSGYLKINDWNRVHIIARGNTLVQIYNGHVMTMLIDDDAENRAMEGLLGLQLHQGPPMIVEFRNIYLKNL